MRNCIVLIAALLCSPLAGTGANEENTPPLPTTPLATDVPEAPQSLGVISSQIVSPPVVTSQTYEQVVETTEDYPKHELAKAAAPEAERGGLFRRFLHRERTLTVRSTRS